jgi:hypothetical protein
VYRALLKARHPVGVEDDATSQSDENQHQEHSTAAATTSPTPKTYIILQPIKEDVEQKEF